LLNILRMNFEKMFGVPPAVKANESIDEKGYDPEDFGITVGAAITLTKIENSGERGPQYKGVLTRDLVPDEPVYLKQGDSEVGTSAAQKYYVENNRAFVETNNSIYEVTVDAPPVVHDVREKVTEENEDLVVPNAQALSPDVDEEIPVEPKARLLGFENE